ncbi:MAG: dihydrodipicolinate synthase family protein [bacterium]
MSENTPPRYRGVHCPVITPFDEAGNVDLEAAATLYDHLIGGGIDGIVILGSIGEFQSIPTEEKRRLIRFAVDHVAGRAAVIAGTGGTVAGEVVELTRFAAESGADAAIIIPPYYSPLGPQALLNFYRAVAGAVDLDVLLYSFPARAGYSLPATVVRTLADEFSNIVGIKDTEDSMSHTRDVLNAVSEAHPRFSVLTGFDEYMYANLLGGGAGTVNGLTNLVPALFRKGFDAFEAGDISTMKQVQVTVNHLMPLYTAAPNFVATFKYAASRMLPGVKPNCAAPEPALAESERRAVDGLLADNGLVG